MPTKLLIIKHTNKTTHIFLSQIVGIIEQDNKWRIMLSDHSYYEELTPLQRIKKFYDITYIKLGNLRINVKWEIDVAEENPSQYVIFTPNLIEVTFL